MKWECEIIDYLREHGERTPTQIGMDVMGLTYYQASGRACAVLKKMVSAGTVYKTDSKKYGLNIP